MNEKGKSQQKKILQNKKVVVFGGGGGWGKRIVEAFQELTPNVEILESDKATKDNYQKAVEDNDVIFLAVPDDTINEILNDTRNFLIKDKVLIDCATNKVDFEEILRDISDSGASVCSTHPMVMPSISPRGQNVIFMPLGNKSELAEQIAYLVYVKTMGMNVEQLNFDQHADLMIILQMVPHLIQRILIEAIGQSLAYKKITIEEISRLASANYMLTELGFGRVGSQETKNSAGIIASGLKTSFGKMILDAIQSNIGEINAAGDDRKKLCDLFDIGVNRMDPDKAWRDLMMLRTNTTLTRLGNLRSFSCKIEASDKPGILLEILRILNSDDYRINMTALDSEVNYDTGLATFDIGIDNCNIDFNKLEADMKEINCSLIRYKK